MPAWDSASLRLDGIVLRSAGRSTIWINGQPQPEDSAVTDIRATVTPGEPGRARLATPEEDAVLSVGQSIDRDTHQRRDRIEDGRIQVPHRP